MFRWTTAHPLPPPLLERLERCGAFRVDWHEREPGVVLIYLAPHQLLEEARLPLAAIQRSAALTLEAARDEGLTAIHGERLLQCDPQELARWVPGELLPCSGALVPPAPLEAAVAAAILRCAPDLATSYEQLELLAGQAGGVTDVDYVKRLETGDGSALVLAWNDLQQQLNEHTQQAERARWADLREECGRIAAEHARLEEQLHQVEMGQRSAGDLLRRCFTLISRLLADGRAS
jgi:hypothetical protein